MTVGTHDRASKEHEDNIWKGTVVSAYSVSPTAMASPKSWIQSGMHGPVVTAAVLVS